MMENERNQGADLRKDLCRLNRELFCLWRYLQEEDLWDDAQDYLEEHQDDELPFDVNWTL